jgi:hypothetical protein
VRWAAGGDRHSIEKYAVSCRTYSAILGRIGVTCAASMRLRIKDESASLFSFFTNSKPCPFLPVVHKMSNLHRNLKNRMSRCDLSQKTQNSLDFRNRFGIAG